MLVEAPAVAPGSVMFSTDWPHPVAEGRSTVTELAARDDIDGDMKSALFVDNAKRLLGRRYQ